MKRTLSIVIAILGIAITVNAQTPNIDFETGTYAGWKYYTGSCCPIVTPTGGTSTPTAGRHTVTSGASMATGCPIREVSPWGGNHSLKLGNELPGAQAERARYYVHVPTGATEYYLVYHYATVLSNTGHPVSDDPRFEVKGYDSATGVINPCDSFTIYGNSGMCRQWSLGTFKLVGMGGRTFVVDFAVGDCAVGGHPGHAYIDMNGELLPAIVNVPCHVGSLSDTLFGPYGYASYSWRDSATLSTIYGTTKDLVVPFTPGTTTYAVIVTPFAGFGCTDTFFTRVVDTSSSTGFVTMPGRSLCVGATTTLTASGTGVWSSASPSVATIGSSTGIVTGVAAGVTAITFTSSSSCSAVFSVTVTAAPSAITGDSVLCVGMSAPWSNAVAGGNWSSSSSAIASVGSGTGVVTAVSAGIATITYTMPGSCYVTKRVTVNVQPAAIAGTASVCTGASITLSNTVPGGIWTSANTSIAIVGSSSGVVTGMAAGTVTISYAVGPCFRTTVVTVNAMPGTITGTASICAGVTTALSTAVAGGTWSSSSAGIATIGSATGIVTGVSTGVCAITYAMPGGCFTTVGITVNPTPAVISGVASVCTGTSTTLSNSVAGGVWGSGSLGIASVGSSTGIVLGVAAGTAVITYAIGPCYQTIAVTVNPAPAAITGTLNVCVGNTTPLSNAVAGGIWSSSAVSIARVGSASGVVVGIAAGVCTITYVMPGGCFSTTNITVDPIPGPILGVAPVCAGASITLSNAVSGGVWSSGSPGVATIGSLSGIVTGVAAGTSSVTYAIGACYRTIIVTVSPTPATVTGTLNVCVGNTTTLGNAVAGGTWSSSNPSVATIGSASGVVSGVAAGTATITYTLPAGCFVTALLTVITFPSAGMITGPAIVCTGQTITLTNTTGTGIWSSSTTARAVVGSSSGVVTGISAGTVTISYTVTYTCGIATATKAITVNPSPAPITGDSIICVNDTIMLSNAVPGGLWSSSHPGIAAAGPSGKVTGITSGTTIISYALGGCYVSKSVAVNPLPDAGTITHSPFISFCIGESITIATTTPGGVWSVANGNAVLTGSTLTAVTPGPDTVFYIVNNSCGADTAMFPLVVSSPPPAPFGDLDVCPGDTAMIWNYLPGGAWAGGLPFVQIYPRADSCLVVGATVGISVISYTISNGCRSVALVTVHPLPNAGSITGQPALCAGGTTTLTNGVGSGAWGSSDTGTATIGMNGHVTAKDTGVTYITYTVPPNIYGCIATDTFVFRVILPNFTVGGTVTNVQCYGETNGKIELNKLGANILCRYLWSNDATTPVVENLAVGIYTVTVTDTNTNCIVQETFLVTQPDSLTITSEVKKDICQSGRGSITLNVAGGTSPYTYAWSNGKIIKDPDGLTAGSYSLLLKDVNGCSENLSILVEDTCAGIVVYNGVSPNGDGINDTWIIENLQQHPTNTVQVYDKWGDLVLERSNYQNDWNGEDKPDGTYFYLIKLNTANVTGGKDTFTGSLLIKR